MPSKPWFRAFVAQFIPDKGEEQNIVKKIDQASRKDGKRDNEVWMPSFFLDGYA